MGLGKKRTKLGKWLDRRRLSQTWLLDETKLNKETISDLCKEDRKPNSSTRWRIMQVLKKIDPELHEDDFWA